MPVPIVYEDFGGLDALERERELGTHNSTKGSPNQSR